MAIETEINGTVGNYDLKLGPAAHAAARAPVGRPHGDQNASVRVDFDVIQAREVFEFSRVDRGPYSDLFSRYQEWRRWLHANVSAHDPGRIDVRLVRLDSEFNPGLVICDAFPRCAPEDGWTVHRVYDRRDPRRGLVEVREEVFSV